MRNKVAHTEYRVVEDVVEKMDEILLYVGEPYDTSRGSPMIGIGSLLLAWRDKSATSAGGARLQLKSYYS